MGNVNKQELRRRIKQWRELLPNEEEFQMRQRLYDNVLCLEPIKMTSCIYCYVDFRKEAGTKDLIQRFLSECKQVAVPRVNGKEMDFYYIKSLSNLIPNAIGILEPDHEAELAKDKDAVVLVPGVAFDKSGNRLGYGGGYYDRFLQREPDHLKIGLAYEFQIQDNLQIEEWDQPMDIMVTELKGGIYDVRRNW